MSTSSYNRSAVEGARRANGQFGHWQAGDNDGVDLAAKTDVRDLEEFGTLNQVTDFDVAFTIGTDGRAAENLEELPPTEVWEQDGKIIDNYGWEPVDGFSGQHGYSGPVMHPSEQLGGSMEVWVRENPGTYVVTQPLDAGADFDDEGGDFHVDGWVLMRKIED